MRLAVLSDIHGNLPALEAVLNDMQSYSPEGSIVAGDLTGGPQVNETIDLLCLYKHWIIKGNSDINLLRYAAGDAPEAWRTHRQFGLLRWAHRHLTNEHYEYLKSQPEQRVVQIENTTPIRVVHGSPRNPYEEILPEADPAVLDLALEQTSEPVLVCGHSHISWTVERYGRLVFNPGAVCGPLNGDNRAQYAILTWRDPRWHAELHAAGYDLTRIRRAFLESGLMDEGSALARAFLQSIETGRDTGKEFLTYAYELAKTVGFTDGSAIPDKIWEQATVTFDWQGA